MCSDTCELLHSKKSFEDGSVGAGKNRRDHNFRKLVTKKVEVSKVH